MCQAGGMGVGLPREGGEGDMVEEKRHGGRGETYAKKQERKVTHRERKEEGKRERPGD